MPQVVEQPTAPKQEERFVMPQPHKGQAVVFYPRGLVQKSQAQIAYILSSNQFNVEVLCRGMTYEGCPHIDDPIIKSNRHARERGVWEFSPRDQEIDKEMSDLKARLAKLESLLK